VSEKDIAGRNRRYCSDGQAGITIRAIETIARDEEQKHPLGALVFDECGAPASLPLVDQPARPRRVRGETDRWPSTRVIELRHGARRAVVVGLGALPVLVVGAVPGDAL